ncbi:MAG: DUF6816 family protein [Cyanobacteria bacterium P01_A01_bin.123]
MSRWQPKRIRRKLFLITLLLLVWLFCSGEARAGDLSDRLVQFPQWEGKPPVDVAEGDLAYPTWMAGTWKMRTVLIDMVAPLAPEIITPGFEGNRQYLNRPVDCLVKFVPATPRHFNRFLPQLKQSAPEIVSDRAYNGLSLARAYLGDEAVKAVKVDPDNPNRQITILRGDRQLVSTITARATESPSADKFVTSEIFQQVFRGTTQPFLNEVETTTAYSQVEEDNEAVITANQVTAIYLSSRDPDYFKALNRPVALYRYQLTFTPKVAEHG